MRLLRSTTSTTTPKTSDAGDNADGKIDARELGKLVVTTLLAASSAAVSGAPPPAQHIARLFGEATSTTMVMREVPRDRTPMGRAVEIALRTGVLTVPPPDIAIDVSTATATATAPTAAAAEDGVATSAILAPDQAWMINRTALASSSPLSQQLFGDLPAVQQALVQVLVEKAVSTDDAIVTWQLFNALRQAVTTGASAAERRALIQTALVKGTSLSTLMTVPGFADDFTPRQQQVLNALIVVGDQHLYANTLVDHIVALSLQPAVATASPTQRQAALDAVFADRDAYVSVYAVDSSGPGVAGDVNAVSDAMCSATPARAFRVTDARAHPDGCAQTITFTTPRGPDVITLITPPTVSVDHPAVAETARALSRVDDNVRLLIRTVVLNPTANPDDAMWADTSGFSADHRSFMTATTTDNSVHVYPVGAPGVGDVRERLLAGTFTHEAGHLLQPRVKADRELQALWTTAVASDDVRASSYAFSNDAEDFAESFAIYATTKGTPYHDAYRALMPARFAAFHAIEAKLLTPTPAVPRT